MLIFIDLGDNTSENNSFNPWTNFVLHSVIYSCWHIIIGLKKINKLP